MKLKSIKWGGGSTPPGDDLTYYAIFRHRSWPVNISKFKYVHPGHFATILRSLGCLEFFWPPLEGVGPPKYFRILMNFGLFDPPWVKISTLPPLWFMIYYHMRKNQNSITIVLSPFWAWPLGIKYLYCKIQVDYNLNLSPYLAWGRIKIVWQTDTVPTNHTIT